ncbi:MAG: DUF1648 domain-containing protein [Chloroflexi bacterium]|nr:DUF1648 domain-containing protein [Chloroflexota bacterium]
MIFKPAKALGLVVGLIVLATIVGIEGFLLASMLRQSPGPGMFVTGLLFLFSIPLLVLWGFWYYELLALRYRLDRNALIIEYGTTQHIIPMERVRRVLPGAELHNVGHFRGVGWPGYLKGRQRVSGLGWLWMYSTEPLERTTVIVTDAASYGISPASPETFLEALQARRDLGPVRPVSQTRVRSPFLTLPLWRDRLFWVAVAIGVLIDVGLWGFVMTRYAHLGSRIPIHFDAQGQADRIVSKIWLLIIPGIGLALVSLNALLSMMIHRREKLAAHLLALVAAVSQAILYLALTDIIQR